MLHMELEIYFSNFDRLLHQLMMNVNQYNQTNFNANSKQQEQEFYLDIIDISYSTARTICSYHLDSKELYYDVITSLLSHLNFIDLNQTNLLLSESRYKRLRDFSKSTRIGELAQGINALFVAKRLNFPYIIDFDLAKEKTVATLNLQTNGRSPDFLVIDNNLSKIGLFESKGNMNGKVRRDLNNAMNQIDNVTNPQCIDTKIPMSIQFKNNNDISNNQIRNNQITSINYGLINTICSNKKNINVLKKLNYASWFYLIGDFERVQSILNQDNIAPIDPTNDPIYMLDTDTDDKNPIYWVRNQFISSISKKPNNIMLHIYLYSKIFSHRNFRIGIYKKVIDSITIPDKENEIFILPEGKINFLKKYPDGTLLYVKK